MKSILLSAAMLVTFGTFAAALLAPAAAHAEACIYDACTATVCNTSGTQTATNWPCDDPQTDRVQRSGMPDLHLRRLRRHGL